MTPTRISRTFFDNFYNVDKLAPRISDQAYQASFISPLAPRRRTRATAPSTPHATYACVDTWLTDFRHDLPKNDVPTLVVHGTEERTSRSGQRRRGSGADRAREGRQRRGRHAQHRLDPDDLNQALPDFLAD
jgi:non-heme chloroperoxidase